MLRDTTLKSLDYNVVMTFRFNNNNTLQTENVTSRPNLGNGT